MNNELLLELAAKSAVIALLTLLFLALAKGRSAAERSCIVHVGLAALVLLPLAMLVLPALEMQVLAAESALPATIQTVGVPALGISEREPTYPPLAAADLAWTIYGAGALLLGMMLIISLTRLRGLRLRARPVVEREWVASLDRTAGNRAVRLLASAEVCAPISWGVIRPTILIDEQTLACADRAQAVLAHELAHIRSLDWPKLVLERTALALLWFNPLAWILAREAHRLREDAADDAVLRSRVRNVEYAGLLMDVANRARSPMLLTATSVAPAPGDLERRIRKVLNHQLVRRSSSRRWLALCCVTAFAIHAPVAALQLVGEKFVPVPAAVPATIVPADAPAASGTEISGRRGDKVVRSSARKHAAASQPVLAAPRRGVVVDHDPVTGALRQRPATAEELEELDRARAELARAGPELAAAREELVRARATLEIGKADLERAKIELERGKRELERARPELARASAELKAAAEALERGDQPSIVVAGRGEALQVRPDGSIIQRRADGTIVRHPPSR